MKNIYFVQVDVSACLGAQNAYLPYTAGVLAASALRSEKVKNAFRLGEFIFLREDTDVVAARLDEPAAVFFVNYCWSTEYNKRLAKRIKELYPSCITVFGGHNVPDDFSFLEKFDFIDILSHGEGEDTTMHLLEAMADGASFETVANLSLRKGGGFIRTETVKQTTLDYPSPYLEGLFDEVVEKHPEISFNAILETSRGCPNKCAYCDWGMLRSKTRYFPLDRVKAEIKWMSSHRIVFVWGADANFGLASRDMEIAEALVEAKETTGYPERMRMNYAKNNFENVFAIVRKFKECEFDRIGATLSFQSMSPTVLENIGRVNNDLGFYKDLLTRYNKENLKTYSEFILGLPGETYESFIEGLCRIFEIGQHFVFDVYGCILLPNSEMGQKEYIEKFGIKTVETEVVRPHFENAAFDVPEYNTIITETATMPREMWVRATLFYYLVKAFHGNGLLRSFAVYLFSEKGLPYHRFYDGIIEYLESRPSLFTSSLCRVIRQDAEEQSRGGRKAKLTFAPCGDVVWDDHEYMVLNILERLDEFYADMSDYLLSFGIEKEMYDSLLAYQKAIIRRPGDEKQTASLHYDIHGFMTDAYVNNLHSPARMEHTLTLCDSDPISDRPLFGKKVIWYGRMGWSSYKDKIIYG